MIKLDQLIEQELIPKGAKVLTKTQLREECVSLKVFKAMSTEDKINCKKFVIADNSVWAAKHGKIIFSSEGSSVWITSEGNSTIAMKDLVDDNLVVKRLITLITLKEKNTNKNKTLEVYTMGENKNNETNKGLMDKLETTGTDAIPTDMLAELEKAAAESAAMVEGANFVKPKEASEKPKKTEAQLEREALVQQAKNQIKITITDVVAADLTELQAFARKNSSLVGFVVGSEPKITASTKSQVKKVNGSVFLTETAKSKLSIVADHNKGVKVDDKYLLKQPTLFVKQSNPTTMLGAVMTVPIEAIVPDSKLRSPEPIVFDSKNTDTVVVTRSKDELAYFLINYLDGTIKANSKTHDTADEEFTARFVQGISKKNIPVVKPVFSFKNRGSKLFTAKNWIPKRRYKTIPLKDALAASDEKQSEINKSLFGRFFNPGVNGAMYDRFDEVSKTLINKNAETGVVTSKYITKSNPEALSIFPFYGSKDPLSVIGIPEKTYRVSNGKESSSFNVYDVTKPDSELEHLNPDTAAEFLSFREALGNSIKISDCIKQVATATKSKAGGSKAISNTDARALLYKATENNSVITVTGVMSRDAHNQYKADIAKISFSDATA